MLFWLKNDQFINDFEHYVEEGRDLKVGSYGRISQKNGTGRPSLWEPIVLNVPLVFRVVLSQPG